MLKISTALALPILKHNSTPYCVILLNSNIMSLAVSQYINVLMIMNKFGNNEDTESTHINVCDLMSLSFSNISKMTEPWRSYPEDVIQPSSKPVLSSWSSVLSSSL